MVCRKLQGLSSFVPIWSVTHITQEGLPSHLCFTLLQRNLASFSGRQYPHSALDVTAWRWMWYISWTKYIETRRWRLWSADVRKWSKSSICNPADARNDDWECTVRALLDAFIDMVPADAKYLKALMRNTPKLHLFHPEDDDLSSAFDNLFSFLYEKDKCQYSVEELLQKIGEYLPGSASGFVEQTLRKYLTIRFGVMTSLHEKKSGVCFRDMGFKDLSCAWYYQKLHNPNEERLSL